MDWAMGRGKTSKCQIMLPVSLEFLKEGMKRQQRASRGVCQLYISSSCTLSLLLSLVPEGGASQSRWSPWGAKAAATVWCPPGWCTGWQARGSSQGRVGLALQAAFLFLKTFWFGWNQINKRSKWEINQKGQFLMWEVWGQILSSVPW